MTSDFKDYELRLIKPDFESSLTDTIIELEHLRKLIITCTTPSTYFFQIKKIFHLMESLGSARIEGNRTTIPEYIELSKEPATLQSNQQEQLKEITNIENALNLIDENVNDGFQITEFFIKSLQQVVVEGLTVEGDESSGCYRKKQVRISVSQHLPPDMISVPSYMTELVSFINEDHGHKYDLLKVALVHHRFGWIHPFGNGNGRTVRLLTYAMLLKYGFNIGDYGRLINPTAIFCCDREKYYEMLSIADEGTDEALLTWSKYVLDGLLSERKKLNVLLDYESVKNKIFKPAIDSALSSGFISKDEHNFISFISQSGSITASKISKQFNLNSDQASYRIKSLKKKGLIVPNKENSREYFLDISSDAMKFGIINTLAKLKLIPKSLFTNERE